LYGRASARSSHSSQPPRGVNHLTTGSYSSSQRFIQPKVIENIKTNESTTKNKRKPAKIKSNASEEKPKRPGKILRSGRISRKPRRDSETDFGSDNSDDSGAKDKVSESEDEEFNLTQMGFGNGSSTVARERDCSSSSSSTDSLAVTNLPLTNFAAFAQSQLLATNLANGILHDPDEKNRTLSSSSDEFESETSDDIRTDTTKLADDDLLDEFTYRQTMLVLINTMQPNQCSIDVELVPQVKMNLHQQESKSHDFLSYRVCSSYIRFHCRLSFVYHR
jgi:hypothetical protein